MRRLTDTDGLTEQQRDILRTVRDFVDAEVIPVASELEHADAYPDGLVQALKELGVFGLTIGEEYGGLGESLLTYALVVEELSRRHATLERTADGWLLRVRRPGGQLTTAQMTALAGVAGTYGSGIVEVTSRANVQLRGLRAEAQRASVPVVERCVHVHLSLRLSVVE